MYTLEDLKNGKCCIANNGTVEELNLVLSAVTGDNVKAEGTEDFYRVYKWAGGSTWAGSSYNEMPVQSVKDFVKQIKQDTSMRKITAEQAQSIIDIACNRWKTKLAKLWGESMVLNKYVEIPEEFYQEMRKTCTLEQHKLFDEIFGPEHKYKVGDWVVYLNETGKNILHQRKINRAYLVYEVSKGGVRTFLKDNKSVDGNGWAPFEDVRLATEEEILKAKCPYYDGQPCLVKIVNGWVLRYSTGKVNEKGYPGFYRDGDKFGLVNFWKKHVPLPEGFIIPD